MYLFIAFMYCIFLYSFIYLFIVFIYIEISFTCIGKLFELSKPSQPCLFFIKYYLINEQECFIGYKTRGEAERFISDKARTASFLNGFKNDPFYTHLISLFTKKLSK